MEEKFGRQLRDGLKLLVRARIRDRVVPAPPGRQIRRVLRRQHLPADHQGARLFRPGARDRRRPRARAGAGRAARSSWSRSPPTGASRRRARARSSRRWSTTGATSPTPRSTRRTATTRSCSTTRSTTRWCGAYFDRIARRRQGLFDVPLRRAKSGAASTSCERPGAARRLRDHRELDRAQGARVLDLGCGDGSLLAYLTRERDVARLRHRDRRRRRARERAQRRQRAAERPRERASRDSTTRRSTA